MLEFAFIDPAWVNFTFKLPLFEINDELMLEACELAFALEDWVWEIFILEALCVLSSIDELLILFEF